MQPYKDYKFIKLIHCEFISTDDLEVYTIKCAFIRDNRYLVYRYGVEYLETRNFVVTEYGIHFTYDDQKNIPTCNLPSHNKSFYMLYCKKDTMARRIQRYYKKYIIWKREARKLLIYAYGDVSYIITKYI
jgi:hypothetical protein